ncbi:hypothetical protein [Rhodoglobus sp.]
MTEVDAEGAQKRAGSGGDPTSSLGDRELQKKERSSRCAGAPDEVGADSSVERSLVMIELSRVLRERRHRQNGLAEIASRLGGEGADGAGDSRNHSDS